MKTNYDYINQLVQLIESDLGQPLNLDKFASHVGFSKYHMHKMFTAVVGVPVYQYMKRRRLSEAAKRLICSKDSIIDIAIDLGYESQQAFTSAFRSQFHSSPKAFRYRSKKFSLMPKFEVEQTMKGESIMDVRLEKREQIKLIGFSASTLKGFFVIPRLWKKLHKIKNQIDTRVSKHWVYALNDYEDDQSKGNKRFDYYACIDVSLDQVHWGDMKIKLLPKSLYVVFSFRGNPKESVEGVIEHIYSEWFPASTYQLNHEAQYDFVRYGEETDAQGISDVEVWVPVLE